MAHNVFLLYRNAASGGKDRRSARASKLLAAIMCVLLIFNGVFGLSGCAAGEEYSFELCGDGYSITGYHGNGGDVMLPERHEGKPVVAIGDRAFLRCEDLTSVTIPNSMRSIGEWAFSSCYSLTDIDIPDSVTEIGDWAFSCCCSLTSVSIPGSVTYIGSGI